MDAGKEQNAAFDALNAASLPPQRPACPVCRAQHIVQIALFPAAAAWEANDELPYFSVALHGAAELLGVILEDGVERSDIEAALGRLLDDIEQHIAEDQVMGGPTKGSA